MKKPEISVIITVFNGEKYLGEAIDSILNQTFTDFELVIVDDGSTDNTLSVIESYKDQRIIHIKNDVNQGISISRNKGIKIAKGKYIATMDADDISFPQRLDAQYHFMESNPQIDVLGAEIKVFGNKTAKYSPPARHEEIFTGLLFGCTLMHPVTFIRKSTIESLNEYYDSYYDSAQDYDYWIRLALRGVRFANMKEVLLKYRWHGENVSLVFNEVQKKDADSARLRFLKLLKISDPEDIIQIHNWLRKGRNLSKANIKNVADWIEALASANGKEGIFPDRALKEILSKKWNRICMSSCRNGLWVWWMFYQHPISSINPPDILSGVKFFVKCLLRVNSKFDLISWPLMIINKPVIKP